jgi:hypothetical protein
MSVLSLFRASHSLRSVEVIPATKPYPGDLLHDRHELVDRHEVSTPEVDRFCDFAIHQERLTAARELGLDDLPTDGSGRFLPAAVVRAVRTEDVVVAGNAS